MAPTEIQVKLHEKPNPFVSICYLILNVCFCSFWLKYFCSLYLRKYIYQERMKEITGKQQNKTASLSTKSLPEPWMACIIQQFRTATELKTKTHKDWQNEH